MHASLLAALLSSVLGAVTGTESEPLRVVWKAHDGCPELNEYWTRITQRSVHLRRASAGEKAKAARIEIRKSAGRSVAKFTVDGEQRELSADTCAELVDALALMTVLQFDPEALEKPAPEAPSAPPAPSESVPLPPVVTPKPLASKRVEDLPPSPPKPPSHSLFFGIAVGGQLFDIGPSAANGPVLAVSVERDRSSFRLTFGHAESDLVYNSAGGASGRFRFDTARIDACPWSWGETMRVSPCGGVSAGVLAGGAENVPAQSHPWLAAHVLARIDLWLFPNCGLAAEVGSAFPLLRRSFVLDQGFAYQPSAGLISSQLALQVRFP